MAKVFISVGHGGSDPGAVGYIKESEVNLQMGLACRDYLVSHGVSVAMSRVKDEHDPVTEEIRECNAYNPDLAVSIHNNAGGGDGCEVYCSVVGGDSKKLAVNVNNELVAMGQNSRGVKIRRRSDGADYYGFIRQTKSPAVIVEAVFVDNKADSSQADTLAEQKTFGVAIAKGVLKTLGIKNKVPVTGGLDFEPYLVKINTAALNVRAGAGASYKVNTTVRQGEVFTIVDERNDWGKLKSGAGWINLGYTKRV